MDLNHVTLVLLVFKTWEVGLRIWTHTHTHTHVQRHNFVISEVYIGGYFWLQHIKKPACTLTTYSLYIFSNHHLPLPFLCLSDTFHPFLQSQLSLLWKRLSTPFKNPVIYQAPIFTGLCKHTSNIHRAGKQHTLTHSRQLKFHLSKALLSMLLCPWIASSSLYSTKLKSRNHLLFLLSAAPNRMQTLLINSFTPLALIPACHSYHLL